MNINSVLTNKEYQERIRKNLGNCLTKTALDLPLGYSGKVRDRYDLGDNLLFVTTDRQSAFDRILGSVPFKGQVLNLTSAWWFEKTKHIVANHIIDIPDPNVAVAQKCKIFPVEFVVRAFITGSSDTSMWKNYEKGVRKYCGINLVDGLRKNQQLEKPVITPTTKEEDHDRLISPEEIVADGWMSKEHWDEASSKALTLFEFGQKTAGEHGLILVDTKYEMGISEKGEILIVDEVHTPDSSRFWLSETYEDRLLQEMEPENIDKEFLRLWFSENCNPYKDETLPEAPKELICELSARYIYLYEKITNQKFEFPKEDIEINERIQNNLNKYRFI